jgi:hypothetical protein
MKKIIVLLMLRDVHWQTVTDVSRERSALVFRVQQSLPTRYHTLNDLNLYKSHYKTINLSIWDCYLHVTHPSHKKKGFLDKIYTTYLKAYSSGLQRQVWNIRLPPTILIISILMFYFHFMQSNNIHHMCCKIYARRFWLLCDTSRGTRLCPGWEIAKADIWNHMERQRLDRLDVICIIAIP